MSSPSVDKIKALQISDVIGQYITLKRAGANYTACCPFHDEKTASFSVNNSRGAYKCFGCGAGGDAIQFVMEHKKLEFMDAVKQICDQWKIDYIQNGNANNTQYQEERKLKESMYIMNNIAADWFQEQLNINTDAKDYLTKTRHLAPETIEYWRLGWAPSGWTGLYKHLQSLKYSEDMIKASGLIHFSDDGKVFDFFRDRIMFPIRNMAGKITGFTGRIITKQTKGGPPKYMNTRETLVYNKSSELYGIYEANSEAAKQDYIYQVEGNMDVITAWQHGIKNIVAGSGKPLSDDQVLMIGRHTRNITIIPDTDALKEAYQNAEALMHEGFNVQILKLETKDLDEWINQPKQ